MALASRADRMIRLADGVVVEDRSHSVEREALSVEGALLPRSAMGGEGR